MPDQHIYTGKELTALLQQVKRELGSEATIVEANKVRSGGVAGFFATESYEVVATSALEDPLTSEPKAEIDLDQSEQIEQHHEPAESHRSSQRSLSTALLDRADAISVQERIELSRPPSPRRIADQVVNEPAVEADQVKPLGVPFLDVLTAEIDRSDPLEEAPVVFAQASAAPGSAPRPRSLSPSAFWARVEAIEEDFAPCDVDGPITTILGELGAGLRAAERLAVDGSGNRREVLVVSQVDSLPAGNAHLVRTNNDLDALLRHWLSSGRECVVVVDRRVGARATNHVRHARRLGAGVERLVVTMPEEPVELLQRLKRLGDNAVVDLAFSAEPSHVIDLVEAGVSVASVAGHRLDSTLLAALACCVSSEL